MPKTRHIKCTRIYVSAVPWSAGTRTTAYAPRQSGSVESNLATGSKTTRQPTRWYAVLCVLWFSNHAPHRDRGVKTTRAHHVCRRVTWKYGNASDLLAAKAAPTETCEMTLSLDARTLRPIPQGIGSNLGG